MKPTDRFHYPFVRQFMADAHFHQRLGGKVRGPADSLAWTLLRDRGLWLLTFHRIAYFRQHHRGKRTPLWWCARLLKSFGTVFSVVFCRSSLREDCEILS